MAVQKVFIAVAREKGGLYSLQEEKASRVQYQVGEWVEAPDGLLAYTSRPVAVWSIYPYDNAQVYEAEGADMFAEKGAMAVFRAIRLARPIAEHRWCYVSPSAFDWVLRDEPVYFTIEEAVDAMNRQRAPAVYCAFAHVDLDARRAVRAMVRWVAAGEPGGPVRQCDFCPVI